MFARKNLVAGAVLVVGLLLLLILDRGWQRSQRAEVRLTTQITLGQLQARLRSCIAPRTRAINLLSADRWSSADQAVAAWDSTVAPIVSLLPGMQALNFVDAGQRIRHVFPADNNQSALGVDLSQNPDSSVRDSIRQAAQTGELVRTDPVELLQGGMGFALYRSLHSPGGELIGFANGVFRIDDLMETCFFEEELTDQFLLSLYDAQEQLIYRRGEASLTAAELAMRGAVDVAGRPWQLELQPSRDLLGGLGNVVTTLWLISGFLGLLFLAWSARSLLVKQEALLRSQTQYRMLVENQTDLMVKLDPGLHFLYASPSACQLVNRSEAQLKSGSFWQLVKDEDRQRAQAQIESLSPRRPSLYFEHRCQTTQGLRWLSWSLSAQFDEAGDLETINGVGRDVTEMKRLQTQLAHAEKRQAVSELASGLSHDFNNLLHITLANVELLRKQLSDEKALRSLNHIYSAVQSGMQLTTRLSSLSRENKAQMARFSINDLVSKTVNLFANSNLKNIRVVCELPDEHLFLVADRVQIERVLLNLLINARDAIGDEGRIRVGLSRETLTEQFCLLHERLMVGDYAVLCIEDTGQGIVSANLKRIFDPYFSSKDKGSNSGLGLANSHSIILEHGGSIIAESAQGEGAVFKVYLPLVGTRSN